MAKLEVDKDSSHKVEIIHEDEVPVVDLNGVVPEVEKTVGDGQDGEIVEAKADAEKAEEGDKTKEEQNKEKKIWLEYDDFCKCFRSVHTVSAWLCDMSCSLLFYFCPYNFINFLFLLCLFTVFASLDYNCEFSSSD